VVTVRYRSAGSASMLAVRLDMLTAIYHRASGQTHLVASPAPEILAALDGRELGITALLDLLRDEFDLVDADEDLLAARLAELVETGLVEQR
jgi:PqqD family protein of HPr-rel-A system